MKRFFTFILLPIIFLTACSVVTTSSQVSAHATQAQILTVFAAASLTDAFTEIGQNFESTHPSVTVKFNFAGSQTLRTQLEQGAVADVFASANQTEMDNAIKDGLIEQNVPQIFLFNKLVVILPPNNPANVQTLNDLTRPGLKLVLAADVVPAGKYARQILDNMSKNADFGNDFSTRVLANVVSNENDVKQVVAKVQLGEADAGIVYVSDTVATPEVKIIEIPANFNVIAKYPIAALAQAPNPNLATQFITDVLSLGGQAILKKWGFAPAQ
ncbi:MAG: molybdate ABC transporter substrate-binding protein [Chloroflexi bacterium]|nr:molybdate ABC transporter substrate-binding protein [Chloroflexota bacterium]